MTTGVLVSHVVDIYCNEREYSLLEKHGMQARLFLYFCLVYFVSAFTLLIFLK